MSLFNELKRRNVFKVGIAYVVASWLLLQLTEVLTELLELSTDIGKIVIILLIVGFVPALIFAWAFELTPEGLKREYEVDRAQSITGDTGRKLNFAIIGLLVIAVGYFAYDKFVLDPERDAALIEAASQAAQPVSGTTETEPSIAVLPFVNMSSDPEQEYFADGISEEILNALARVSGLKVAGRTSSFAFKGKADDLNAIGQALRVDHILEGSVRKAGDRVRITAQLIEVEEGYHLWSETWDRELDDIFAIQDEISGAILGELKSQLLGELERTAHTDAHAYELHLSAKQHIYTRNQASLELAAELLTEALAIDETYAPAHAQLGIATILLSERNYGDIPMSDARGRGLAHLERALELDPEHAEALAGMGLYFAEQSLDHEAVEWLNRALEVNPNLVNANTWLATSLSNFGRLQEAVEVNLANHERDPLHAPTYSNLGDSLGRMGRAQEGLAMLERLDAFLPGEASVANTRGHIHFYAGDFAKAFPLLKQSYELEPFNLVNELWYSGILFWLGEYEQAAAMHGGLIHAISLFHAGRTEEALIEGNAFTSAGGYPYGYLYALIQSGQHARLVQELDARWGSLEAFEEAWPDRDGVGADMMMLLALAYRATDQGASFEDALRRMRASLDVQAAEGADNFLLTQSEVYYFALINDIEKAVAQFERMLQQGGIYHPFWDSEYSPMRALQGDPRYEAGRQVSIDRLNTERQALGLDPLDI